MSNYGSSYDMWCVIVYAWADRRCGGEKERKETRKEGACLLRVLFWLWRSGERDTKQKEGASTLALATPDVIHPAACVLCVLC